MSDEKTEVGIGNCAKKRKRAVVAKVERLAGTAQFMGFCDHVTWWPAGWAGPQGWASHSWEWRPYCVVVIDWRSGVGCSPRRSLLSASVDHINASSCAGRLLRTDLICFQLL